MQKADVSPWANKWNEVYDFTGNREVVPGQPNWVIKPALNWKMMAPLGEVEEKVSKVQQFKQNVRSMADIKDSDLELITLEFDEDYAIGSGLFDVGPYFNAYSQNMIKGVIPSA